MRSWLEEEGWLQGCFVEPEDVQHLKQYFKQIPNEDIYLLVASQSCDVCANPETESEIEFSIARRIEILNGNYTYNKHPRRLHITAHTLINNTPSEIFFELYAHEKIKISKVDITNQYKTITPCNDIQLSNQTITQFSNWLAGRYNRPALPTSFEKRFNEQWKKNKQFAQAEKVGQHILGIYVDITPDKEIPDNESYMVQLLFLISHEAQQNHDLLKPIELLAKTYHHYLSEANMLVSEPIIATEQQISLATFKQFKRLYFDSLSYKHATPLPFQH